MEVYRVLKNGSICPLSAMTEPRKADLWEQMRRMLGYVNDPEVINPQWMERLSPVPGEQTGLRDRYRNNAISRQRILAERLRQSRLAAAKKKREEQQLIQEMNQTIPGTNKLNQHSTGVWNIAQERYEMKQKGMVPDWNPMQPKE